MTIEMYFKSLRLVLAFYFGSAILFYFIIYKLEFFKKRKIRSEISENLPEKNQIVYSTIYLIAAAFFDALFVAIAQAKFTRVYLDFEFRGAVYLVFSFIMYIVFYEVFYYFSHRLLHTNFLYKHIHSIHHKVKSPTVTSIYCFHPIESVGHFIFHMTFVLTIPIHPYALILSSIFLHQGNIVGHLGYEIYTKNFKDRFRFLNSASGHFLHHQAENCNYGYAFTILDTVFKTYQKKIE